MRVAVLGTGTMGAGMARSARREGLDVTVWNRTAERARPLAADGITVAGSVTEAVSAADAVITMLYDTDAVLAVTAELVAALDGGAVWLQAATVGPGGIGRIAAAAGDATLLDAPVLGTKQPAEQGTLVPLVSGDPAAIDRVRPLLEAIGARTVVAGERLGDGSALKLACNAWLATITAATAQSVALARGLGVDPSLFLQAIDGGPVNSPYAQLKGGAMLARDWTPSFALDGLRKDIALVAGAAADAGVDTTLADALARVFAQASERGHGADDIAAVVTAWD
ncbi:3-hydroxyisobutyrate dehydrogenase [Jatrophihabitans endophyticus]|uniref:3-hydroxyisobutyrate dehydrogenase n=2 Tax=Jatrophihabitans endophyticus TaxID=1206085 RepID=A0A1M5KIR9_9ACTN|nr:3-hydroxyisobutyrate dehydrogenase [Jatrophihabitans endophyticus]